MIQITRSKLVEADDFTVNFNFPEKQTYYKVGLSDNPVFLAIKPITNNTLSVLFISEYTISHVNILLYPYSLNRYIDNALNKPTNLTNTDYWQSWITMAFSDKWGDNYNVKEIDEAEFVDAYGNRVIGHSNILGTNLFPIATAG